MNFTKLIQTTGSFKIDPGYLCCFCPSTVEFHQLPLTKRPELELHPFFIWSQRVKFHHGG